MDASAPFWCGLLKRICAARQRAVASWEAARHSFKIVQAVPMPMQYKFLPRAGMAGDGSVWRKTVFKLQETLHVYLFQPAERR